MDAPKLFARKKIKRLHHCETSATSTSDAPVPVPNQLLQTVIEGSFQNDVSPIDQASDSSGGAEGGGGGVFVVAADPADGLDDEGGDVVAGLAAQGDDGGVVEQRIDMPANAAIDQELNDLIARLKLVIIAFWVGFVFDGVVLTFLEVVIEVADLRAKVCSFLIYIVVHSVWQWVLMSTQLRELTLSTFLENLGAWVRFFALFLFMILIIMGISASSEEFGAILGYATSRYILSMLNKFIGSYMVLSLVRENMDTLHRLEAALAEEMERGAH
uniref:uncharacterized protein LOC105351766 n=1 Tax=Fragaria vesca subsp. vesca TaxID=101020 RepID=UPI0005C8D9E9|nr:PREDICTED: uncharacterized protein LOC105351766 [Fragaria vesca subsp. vesca]